MPDRGRQVNGDRNEDRARIGERRDDDHHQDGDGAGDGAAHQERKSQKTTPPMPNAAPTIPAATPRAADHEPVTCPPEDRIRRSELLPDQIANGASKPKGRDSAPRTRDRVAPRSRTREA